MAWGIQTVYLPRENLRFLEEWLSYHTLLGAEYFYLYDNTGSRTVDLGNCAEINGKNKHGLELDFSLTDAQIAELEAPILRKFPVTKVTWQPRANGEIVYGQPEACDHFAESTRVDWCAFIDIDEFLCTPHRVADLLDGPAVRISQKKFEHPHRFGHDRALAITKTFSIDTTRWGSKLIVNMKHYAKGGATIHALRLVQDQKPVSLQSDTLRFNHYNHNRRGHQWLLDNCHLVDPSWSPVAFEHVFNERCELLRERSKQIDYARFEKTKL